MRKKCMSLLLTAVMLLSCLPMTATAEEGKKEVFATRKVIDALTLAAGNVENPISLASAPKVELEITAVEPEKVIWEKDSFTLHFENAKLDASQLGITAEEALTEEDKKSLSALVEFWDKDGKELQYEAVVENLEDLYNIEFQIEGDEVQPIAAGDRILIALPVVLENTSAGSVATVAVTSNDIEISSGKEELVFVEVLEKGLSAKVKKLRTVLPKESVKLRPVRIETKVGSLPEELELKLELNEGFEFLDVSDADSDVIDIVIEEDNPSTAVVKLYESKDQIDIENLKIKATTAELGDIAEITVTADGYSFAKVEVARVDEWQSVKIVNAWSKTNTFDGMIIGNEIPELQIRMNEIANSEDQNEITFKVELDHAVFVDEQGETLSDEEATNLITFIADEDKKVALEEVRVGSEADTLDVKLTCEDDEFQTDDRIVVALQSKMNTVAIGQSANVSVSGTGFQEKTLAYCNILEDQLYATIKRLATITEAEKAVLCYPVKIKAEPENLPSELKLKLNEGFVFTDLSEISGGSGVTVSEGNAQGEILLKLTDETDEIRVDGIFVKAAQLKAGSVATVTISAEGFKSGTVEIAKVADTAEVFVDMTAEKNKEIPVFYSGITEDGENRTLEVTIQELFADGWSFRKKMYLTLPEGVYVTDVDVIESNLGMNGRVADTSDVEDVFVQAYKEGDHTVFAFEKRSFDDVSDDGDILKLRFALNVIAVPGFEGDVTLTLSGDLLTTRKVTIAKFAKPYTVAVDTLSLRQGQNGTMNDIVITEAAPGLWETVDEKGAYVFELYDENDKVEFLPNNKGTVTVNKESGAAAKDVKNAVGFTLTKESVNVPAVVTLSGYAVKTTGNSLGNYPLLLKVPYYASLLEETLVSGATVGSVEEVADIYDIVDEDAVTVYQKSSGSSNNSNKNNNNKKEDTKTNTPAVTETPVAAPVTIDMEQNAESGTVVENLSVVAEEQKAELHQQLKEQASDISVIGEGKYTFAIAEIAETSAAEPSATTQANSGNAESGSMKDPAKVSLDMTGQDTQDTAHLTLVKYETQPDGTVKVIKLGGTFDPETNSFSAYVDGDGVYDLVYDPDVVKMTYTVGQTEMSMNDENQESVAAPVIIENRTMVPLRTIAENFGAEVSWDGETQTVQIKLDGKVLTLKIGEEVEEGMGAAMIIGDRTVVPLRYIGESFDATVRWIPSTQGIEIVK